jgi:hypothetical protein
VLRVLGVGVLAVVDQQRGVAGELEAGDPALVQGLEIGAESRLVIGDVGERAVAVVDPVAERRAAVGDRGGADPRRADLPLGLRAMAEGNVAGELADLDRGERRRDVATISVWGRNAGAKKTSPWMWSRCRWVRRMWSRVGSSGRAFPRLRIPVPASRASSEPSERVTPTQEVLPP